MRIIYAQLQGPGWVPALPDFVVPFYLFVHPLTQNDHI